MKRIRDWLSSLDLEDWAALACLGSLLFLLFIFADYLMWRTL
jgi:hypothetical protein